VHPRLERGFFLLLFIINHLIVNEMNPFKALALLFVLLVVSAIVFLFWYQSRNPKESGMIFPAADVYSKEQLLLKPVRLYASDSSYRDTDTLWRAIVYGMNISLLAPTNLAANGVDANWYYGPEDSLLAYAERKGIRKFCFKDSVGGQAAYNYYIRVAANEPFYIHFALWNHTTNALIARHKAGWSRAGADEASWSGDTLFISGKQLFMSAEGITPCVTCKIN